MDDKSECSVYSIRVKHNVDLSLKHMHIAWERIKKSWKEFMKGTWKIPGNLYETFNLNDVVQGSKT